MQKTKVNAKYINAVIVYLNKLLTGNRKDCGMCTAMYYVSSYNRLEDMCKGCPLDADELFDCTNRFQLRRSNGEITNSYDLATPASIEERVQWIIDQVNERTSSEWTIYLG